MTGLRYLGHGEFIPGVPARDLRPEEAAAWRNVIAEHRRNTGRPLYAPVEPTPAPQADRKHKGAKAQGGERAGGADDE